jgi:hypothetical protein
MQQVIEYQAQITEKNRDIELQTIKIESLENIVKRRDHQATETNSQLISAMEDKVC